MSPRVSVVVPTFGRATHVRAAVEGLARCRVPSGGREIIVIDDGSPEPVEPLLATIDGVRVIRQANAGPASARNRGIEAAAGELIAFTDDDTIPDPEWLVELVAAIDEDPRLGGVGGRIVPQQRGFIADFVQVERFVDHGRTPDGCVAYLVTANAVFRHEALTAIGGFDTSFALPAGEDVDLSARMVAEGWILSFHDGAVIYHDHRTSPRDLVRTVVAHARAREVLEQRHAELLTSMRETSGARHLAGRYRRSRQFGVGRARSAFYLLMHFGKVGVSAATRVVDHLARS